MTELTGKTHKVLKPGGPTLFQLIIKATQVFSSDKGEMYPAWQGMQYMRDMYLGRVKFSKLDNVRYDMKFATARDVLAAHLKKSAGN